jgi:hypothetical protein|tara:strand:+ start:2067 stop:2249 length:183 start_codon:yes stop_codon:yes gene_type:complete
MSKITDPEEQHVAKVMYALRQAMEIEQAKLKEGEQLVASIDVKDGFTKVHVYPRPIKENE